MCKNIPFPHHPAIKICPFVDSGISCIFWILVTPSRFLRTMSLSSLAMLHFLNLSCHTFRDSHSLFHPSVFFTNSYAVLLMLMPLPQSASLLTFILLMCAHSQPGGMGLLISKGLNDVITITCLGKLSWFYVSSTFPPFSQKRVTEPGSQHAVPFLLSSLLGRATRSRKNWEPIEKSLLKLIVHYTQAL